MNIQDLTGNFLPADAEEKRTFDEFLEYVRDVLEGRRRMSFSALKDFRDGGPYGYMVKRRVKFKPTDAIEIGNIVEAILFDPDNVERKYAVWGARRAGNEYKAFVAEHEAAGTKVITKKMWDTAIYYASRVLSNPEAKDLIFSTTETQRELLFNIRGIQHIGYTDAEGERGSSPFVVDLKMVTNKTTTRQLEWEMLDRWFDAQAALYTIGRESVPFYFIVLMGGGRCEVYKVTPNTRELAFKSYCSQLEEWKKTAEAGELFPGIWWRGPEAVRGFGEKVLSF